MPRFSKRVRAIFECECGRHAWSRLDAWAVVLVSPQDVPVLWSRRWQLRFQRGKAYVRYNLKVAGKQTVLYLHRVITNAAGGVQVDHRNRNGLDNQRGNLRSADQVQNNANAVKRSGCTSSFKGVAWDKRSGKWVAYINAEGRRVSIGAFRDEEQAARAYDERARAAFGSFARLNFPIPDLEALAERGVRPTVATSEAA